MYVYQQTTPQPAPLPGIAHATWAGQQEGLSQISLWRQSLAAGACTPPHHHDCDEVVLCESGEGELHVDGQVLSFGAGSTLALPGGRAHQIFNAGPMPLEILGVFGGTPVATYGPDGEALALPWRS